MDQESTTTAETTDQESASGAPQEGTPSAESTETEGEPKVFDEAYVKQLRREAASTRTRLAEAESQLREFADKDKSETERLNESLATATKRAAEAETRLLRFEIAAERKLDAEAASLLTGDTREEIEANADRLQAYATRLAGEAKPPTPKGFDGGARTATDQKLAPDQEHNALLMKALGRAS